MQEKPLEILENSHLSGEKSDSLQILSNHHLFPPIMSGKFSHLIARKIQHFPHSTISCQKDNTFKNSFAKKKSQEFFRSLINAKSVWGFRH
jgi:hypothetical protein